MPDEMPDWRAELRARLRDSGLAPADEAGVVEELAQHLELQYDELRARVGAAEAARALLAGLGTAELHEAARVAGRRAGARAAPPPVGRVPARGGWMEAAWQDVRYGARSLARAPAFTTVAVLSLALGLGATTAIFGLMNAVLLERLPIPRPEELVHLRIAAGGGQSEFFDWAEYRALREAPGVTRVVARTGHGATIVVGTAAEYTWPDLVSGDFFETVGVRPLLGRTLGTEDERAAAPVAVVSHAFWERRLGADPSALGRTITIAGAPFAVVGVMPKSYRGLTFGGSFAVAVPLSAARLIGHPGPDDARRGQLSLYARLPRGGDDAAAGRALDAAWRRCCAGPAPGGASSSGAGERLILADASRGTANPKSDLRGQYRAVLGALMAGVAVLLLIACANVGNLLLVRASARSRELGLRVALGATRARIVGQLLTESLLLALAGGLLGLALARAGTGLLAHGLPLGAAGLADAVALRPSGRILAFAAAATLAATLLFGVVPALRATGADLLTPLKGGTGPGARRGLRLDRGLVVAQMALALVLVCAAGLLVATLRHLRDLEGVPDAAPVLLATAETRGTPHESRGVAPIHGALLERVRALPGVSGAALSTTVPVFGGRTRTMPVRVPGAERRDDDGATASYAAVTPDYFATTGIGLERGREFDAGDEAGAEPVAIVSRAFARRLLPGHDPLGASFSLGDGADAPRLRVIGIARDALFDDLRAPPPEMVYVPLAQAAPSARPSDMPFLVVSVRARGEPGALAPALRRALEEAAPGIRIERMHGFERALDEELARERLAAGLATLFGAIALGLAAVGLYGVVAYGVSRRTREIGVRMALGARAADALWLVARQTLALTLAGVAIGVPLALAAAGALRAQLYGVGARDPLALAGAAMLLVVVGAVAGLVPARRAAQVDPASALRSE